MSNKTIPTPIIPVPCNAQPADIGLVDRNVSLLHQHKYSVPEASDLLNISETKVRELIRQGQLPVLKLTKAKVLILESDLEAFLMGRHGHLTTTPVSRKSGVHALPDYVEKSELFQIGRTKKTT